MKTLLSLLLGLVSSITTVAQIQVSSNHRYLIDKDGQPFFWLGDTNWELFHRLTREETIHFLDTRAAQGFNVIQAVALAEFNGIREPNRYGDYPLNNEDPTQLLITPGNQPGNAYEYDYWDHVDFVIEAAAARGLYIGLLPTWGDKVTVQWGEGPRIFDETNAKAYGRILAHRFARFSNILWILGGDRPAVYEQDISGVKTQKDDRPIWRAMAAGIEEILGASTFITYHPSGGAYRTTNYLLEEPWLDMHAFQSGHGSRESDPWNWVLEDMAKQPQKPTLDMEPCYEDHPVNPWDGKWSRQRGYFSAFDVRVRMYRSVLAGAAGVTYGHHQVWQFLNNELYPPINIGDTLIGWKTALHAEAATQVKHLKKLVLSRPIAERIVDPLLLMSPAGTTYKDVVLPMRDEAKSYAMIHVAENKQITINLLRLTGKVKNVSWFNPRTGVFQRQSSVTGSKSTFTPPRDGRDWVLLIEDASRGYVLP